MGNYVISNNQIELLNLTFYAFHGVLPEERQEGNTFVVDLLLHTDFSPAICSDNLADTINYADVYEVVRGEMSIPSNLLEHVCGRIAASLLDAFAGLSCVRVRVTKKNPPIEGAGSCESVVALTMKR